MDEETDEETGGDGRGDRPATTNRYRTVTASDGQAGRPTMCQQRTSSDGRAATGQQTDKRRASRQTSRRSNGQTSNDGRSDGRGANERQTTDGSVTMARADKSVTAVTDQQKEEQAEQWRTISDHDQRL